MSNFIVNVDNQSILWPIAVRQFYVQEKWLTAEIKTYLVYSPLRPKEHSIWRHQIVKIKRGRNAP